MAFIEDLQRRLTLQENKPGALSMSQSTPNLAQQKAEADAQAAMNAEHQTPFELRALEVALDVVSHLFFLDISPDVPEWLCSQVG